MGFQISFCKFHKNSLSETLLEEKDVSLWDELTQHKAVSQKASFQFLYENIFFFTIALSGLPNITCKLHNSSLSEIVFEGKAVTLWDDFTDCREVSPKVSFSFLSGYISFDPIVFKGSQAISSQITQKEGKQTAPQNTAVTQSVEVTHQKVVSQKASFQFLTEGIS